MIESLDTFSYKLRLAFASLLVIAGLLTLPFLLRALWLSPTAHAAPSPSNSNNISTEDSPNAITRGMFSGMDGLSKTTDSIEQTVTNTLSSVTKSIAVASVQAGKAVAHSVSAGAMATANAAVASVSFTGRTAGSAVSFIASPPGIDDIIKPADADNTQVPVIDENNNLSTETANSLAADNLKQEEIATIDSEASWPIRGVVTTEFGVPHWPFQPTHTGIDISDNTRSGATAIRPFKPGIVKEAILSRSGLGNHVIVDHGGGLTSLYGHLYSISVKAGQKIDKNTTLGYEGSTGASTGTHLHFEIRVNGEPVNPRKYINGQP